MSAADDVVPPVPIAGGRLAHVAIRRPDRTLELWVPIESPPPWGLTADIWDASGGAFVRYRVALEAVLPGLDLVGGAALYSNLAAVEVRS